MVGDSAQIRSQPAVPLRVGARGRNFGAAAGSNPAMTRLLLLAAWLAATPAWAADPLKSGACAEALATLQRADADHREAARGAATRACLGGSGVAQRPSPTAQAPLVVPPPIIDVPAPPRPPVELPPSPAVAIERPPVITACDAGGCWDSNGTRLNSAGPMLIGPGGACTTAGAVVRCP
jgi:hypothetical protein